MSEQTAVLEREEIRTQEPIAEISVPQVQRRGYLIAKRLFDVIASFCALVVLSPVFLFVSIFIKLDSKGPVIFVHKRFGKNGKIIKLLKFRTMVQNAERLITEFTPEQKVEWEAKFKLEHDPRITRVGKVLRKTSLDELPQLINILKGELSIVGPRPIIQEELEQYGKDKGKLLSVIPGLTGYWQAYARSDCSYEQRRKMELYYIENANFWWDIRIIFKTVEAVIRKKGAK